MKQIISIVLLGFVAQSYADKGVCNHKDEKANAAESAFCKSFDGSETACRANNSKCTWKNKTTTACVPVDQSANSAEAAYCSSFSQDESACRTNNSKCKWIDNDR